MKGKIVYRVDGTKEYQLDGKAVSKRAFDRAIPTKLNDEPPRFHIAGSNLSWPRRDPWLGIVPHAKDIEKAESHAASRGVPTQYDRKTGDAIITSWAHEQKFLKLHEAEVSGKLGR
jgi:hypothetical protein